MNDYANNQPDWAKWGALAAIAAVVVTALAIYVAHYDQQEKVYITLTPVRWEVEGNEATIFYNLTVTGKSPARNLFLAERCVQAENINQKVELTSSDKRLLSQSMLPGTIQRKCFVFGPPRPSTVKLLAEVTYEDGAGQHAASFCFSGAGVMQLDDLTGHKEHGALVPCWPD
jgi:hypothetical protein